MLSVLLKHPVQNISAVAKKCVVCECNFEETGLEKVQRRQDTNIFDH